MITCATGSILCDDVDGLWMEGLVVAAGCRTWACPVCGPKKARQLRQRLTTKLMDVHQSETAYLQSRGRNPGLAWQPFKFLTLTTSVKNFVPPERYAAREWRATSDEARRAHRAVLRAWNR